MGKMDSKLIVIGVAAIIFIGIATSESPDPTNVPDPGHSWGELGGPLTNLTLGGELIVTGGISEGDENPVTITDNEGLQVNNQLCLNDTSNCITNWEDLYNYFNPV